jgi:adenine deaminase
MAWTECSLAEAVECVTSHPAKLLRIDGKKGSLTSGLDADLVILDDDGGVYQTWKFGKKVYDVEEPDLDESSLWSEAPLCRVASNLVPPLVAILEKLKIGESSS